MARDRGTPWTPEDVANAITSPVYAGIGPYPAVVPDDEWIAAVSKMIKERGAAPVLREILANLRAAFPSSER